MNSGYRLLILYYVDLSSRTPRLPVLTAFGVSILCPAWVAEAGEKTVYYFEDSVEDTQDRD